jgi:cytochrome b6-f complex iron-sulfur subunit
MVHQGDSHCYTLLAICIHRGCTPIWFGIENELKCPCQESGCYRDSTNDERPAPRPLDRIKIFLTFGGQLVVDNGMLYRMVPGRDPDEQYPQSLQKV